LIVLCAANPEYKLDQQVLQELPDQDSDWN